MAHGAHHRRDLPPQPRHGAGAAPFHQSGGRKYSHIVARFRRELTHPERTRETELGNLFADIFTRSLGIDIMLIGSGSIRAEKLGPIVTYGDLIEVSPTTTAYLCSR